MKNSHRLILLAILILAFKLRTFLIVTPLGDWHSWRQSATAGVALEYTKNGIDLLHPTHQDISSVPSGKDNPEGYFFVEFPIYPALHASIYELFPGIDFIVVGRLLTIIASTATVLLIYLITFQVSGATVAFFSALTYAVIPYNIFYGRTILPEPWMVLFSLAFVFFFIQWVKKKKLMLAMLSTLFLALAILMKPTALIFLLPAGIYLLDHSKDLKKDIFNSFLIAAFAFAPFIAWRYWIQQYPEGIPANKWLLNGNKIRFKGAFFRWIFGERISKLILGYWGLIPVGIGIFSLKLKSKESRFYAGMLLGSLVYLFTVATGNVQHDYYQILIMPSLSMLYGLGAAWMLKYRKGLNKLFPLAIFVFSLLMTIALGWYEIRGFFNINNPAMVKAGQKADEILPKDAKVIAPYLGDTAFLFQTNRQGWPIGGNIEDKIQRGANYYITTSKNEEYNQLIEQYELIYEEDEFAIINLKTSP